MLKSVLCQQYGPSLATLSQEINRLGSVGERRICPVPSAYMPEGVVQIQLVAQTQGWPCLVYLLRFLVLASVAPGSKGTKPNRLAWISHLESTEQLKFHFKIVYKESLKDYLTTSKRIDLCIENLNCIPSLSAAPFEKWVHWDVFCIPDQRNCIIVWCKP